MSLDHAPRPDYGKPFFWWGTVWKPPQVQPLSNLVAGRMLSMDDAEFLVGALNHGKSLAVVSDESGAGKSTLLWALAVSSQAGTSRVYIRGQYEPFAFSQSCNPGSPPPMLMINEVSPHLPVYCWGRVRDRLFGEEFVQYQKVATAHSPSLEAFFDGWISGRTAAANAASRAFDVAVLLSRSENGDPAFHVRDIKSIA